jgi:glycosyltransferase involved in cell wall biosynthesis
MRVLHIIDSIGTGGGAERNIAAVMPELRGFQNHLVHLLAPDNLAAQVKSAGATVERVPYSGPADLPRVWRRLRELAASADVVHTQTLYSDLWGRLASLGRAPIVTTVQSPPYEPVLVAQASRLGRAKINAFRGADVLLSSRAARVVAVSGYVRDMIVRRLRVDPARIEVIYNAIDVQAYHPLPQDERAAVRAELGLARDDQAVVAVGKLQKTKGQHLLIDAMSGLRRRVPGAVLLLAGNGVQQAELEARARAVGVADRVRFLGLRQDLPRVLGAADAMALASEAEGLSLAVAEAMAVGLPCLLSAIPPHREMQQRVAEEGVDASLMRVEEASPEAWARGLEALLGDPEARESLGAASQRAAARHFNARVTGAALARVLREVAGG